MRAVDALVDHAVKCGLIEASDVVWAKNTIADAVGSDKVPDVEVADESSLQDILDALTEDAYSRGVIADDSAVSRDLLDTEIMGRLTPKPSDVNRVFEEKMFEDPETATDWFYKLCIDTNYIRSDRIKKDIRWEAETDYGTIELSINLAKPEKDPKMIAKMGKMKSSSYPKCQLCIENTGYAGRLDHPARQNLRMIPCDLDGDEWFFQYSPYSYYSEHCIVLNKEHVPMKISERSIRRLLAFVTEFPHYFVGSNADLPIVGGSILSHDHFQGGRHVFPMEKAPVKREVAFEGFDDVKAGIVKWPMSVVRLTCSDKDRLAELACRIIDSWRNYTDENAFIFAETDGVPHNTVTPIARRRGNDYELDLVLRNNITTEEHPLGLYHPHEKLHHIKKENIGLIEVMGLAVLPGRLRNEFDKVAEYIVSGKDLRTDPDTEKHADWVDELRTRYTFTEENVMDIIKKETGQVFAQVLEDAGVFKNEEDFMKFIGSVPENTL